MAQKKYYLIVDTETTITDKVVDFGAIIVDTKGSIIKSCAVLVNGIFGVDDLFYSLAASDWTNKASLDTRMQAYRNMLSAGTRTLASVAAINRWLERAKGQFNPEMTAYNLAFDSSKCGNTGIDLSMFSDRFCLWAAAVGNICNTKKYREFVLQNHAFNNVTDKGNMTFSTNAENVCGFIKGQFTAEPHTALEDAVDFELPILQTIIKKRKWRERITPYDWKKHQVREHFQAK